MFVHRHQSPNGQIESAATIGGSKQERAAVFFFGRNVLLSSSLDIIGIYNKQKMPKKWFETKQHNTGTGARKRREYPPLNR